MNFLLLTLFAFFLAVQASPLLVPRAKLDVFTPNIISPNKSTIWSTGQTETVEWETDNAPKNISNAARIYLVYPDNSSPWILLAKDFSLLSGKQDIVVPTNLTSGQYSIILFGDSGDKSEPFSIVLSAASG